MAKTIKGELVIKYIKKNPKLPNQTLAKKLIKEHPFVFRDIDNARYLIRYYKGQSGNSDRKVGNKELYTKPSQQWNELFEDGITEVESKHFEIAKDKSVGILADIHAPFQQGKALEYSFRDCAEMDILILNGDIWDCFWMSRFMKDPKMRLKISSTKDELDAVYKMLATMRNNFDGPIFYKMGNHEDRWEKYLRIHADALLGFQEFEIQTILRLGELQIQPIESHRIIKYGNFYIAHGHEHWGATGDPKFIAKNRLKKLQRTEQKEQVSIISSHSHRTDHFVEPILGGGEAESWTTGCLCKLLPEYTVHNQWNQGHAKIENGEVYNVRF